MKSPVCDFFTCKSGAVAFNPTLALSSPMPSFGVLSGSGVLEAVTCAVLVIAFAFVILAVIVNVCVPTGTLEIVQLPVTESYVPTLGLLEMNVNPAGSGSLRVTFCAALGPVLVS